jgi:hypothetical protein
MIEPQGWKPNDPKSASSLSHRLSESFSASEIVQANSLVEQIFAAHKGRTFKVDGTGQMFDGVTIDLAFGESGSEILTISRGIDSSSQAATCSVVLWSRDGQQLFGSVFDQMGSRRDLGYWGESSDEVLATLQRALKCAPMTDGLAAHRPNAYGV